MDCGPAIFRRLRRFIALGLIAHLLLIATMAVSPGLHEWVHGDAGHADHDCAVTLFAHGGCDDLAEPAVAPVVTLRLTLEALAAEEKPAARSLRFSGVLEHAPPPRG